MNGKNRGRATTTKYNLNKESRFNKSTRKVTSILFSARPLSAYIRRITMDNTVIKDVLLDKKLDRYGFDNNDFLASGELTVTITLSEYRKLVKDVATAQARIDKAEADRYDRNRENERLTEENNRLKAELYEMQKASEVIDKDEENTEWKSE